MVLEKVGGAQWGEARNFSQSVFSPVFPTWSLYSSEEYVWVHRSSSSLPILISGFAISTTYIYSLLMLGLLCNLTFTQEIHMFFGARQRKKKCTDLILVTSVWLMCSILILNQDFMLYWYVDIKRRTAD